MAKKKAVKKNLGQASKRANRKTPKEQSAKASKSKKEFKDAGKKLNMGEACVHFQTAQYLALSCG